jgi:hypothetical protein
LAKYGSNSRHARARAVTSLSRADETAVAPIADLARRQLVVVERQGQAHIIRFCAKVTPWVKPGS